MKSQLRFVGVGGQGVILAGEILSADQDKSGRIRRQGLYLHISGAWRPNEGRYHP